MGNLLVASFIVNADVIIDDYDEVAIQLIFQTPLISFPLLCQYFNHVFQAMIPRQVL